jgi:hypothetical protein
MKQLQTHLEQRKLNLAAGSLLLWVALAPWIWGYSSSPSAVASHVFFFFAFGPLTLLILVLRPAAFVVLVAGVWLALSPWLLGYATNHSAWLSDGVTGILLNCVASHAVGFSLSAAVPKWAKRRRSAAASGELETAGSRP